MAYRKKQSQNNPQENSQQQNQQAKPSYVKKQAHEEKKTDRVTYAKKDFLTRFDKQDALDMSLLGKDKLSLANFFSPEAKLPEAIEPTAVAEFPHERRGQRPRKESWRYQKPHYPRRHEPEVEEDADPEWADFEPTSNNTQGDFFGRQMTDERELRQKIQTQKLDSGKANQEEVDYLQNLIDSMLPEEVIISSQAFEDDFYQEEEKQTQPPTMKMESIEEPDVEKKFEELVALHEMEKEIAVKVDQEKPAKASALSNLEKMFKDVPVKSTEKNLLKLDKINELQGEERKDAFALLMEATNPFAKYLLAEDSKEEGKCWHLDENALPVQYQEQLMKTNGDMYVIYKNLKNPAFQVKSEKYTEGELKKFEDFTPKVQLITIGKTQSPPPPMQNFGGYNQGPHGIPPPRYPPPNRPMMGGPRPWAAQPQPDSQPPQRTMPSPSKVQPFIPKARTQPPVQQFEDPALIQESEPPQGAHLKDENVSNEDLTNQLKSMLGFGH